MKTKSFKDQTSRFWLIVLALFTVGGGLLLLLKKTPDLRLEQQREAFLAAEKLLGKADQKAFWAASKALEDYPLYPYLQFRWLMENVQEGDKIHQFLTKHPNNRYASLLRAKWFAHLAGQKRWQDLIGHFQVNDSTEADCHYSWALYNTGDRVQAFESAKRLWLVGHAQPKACDPLFAALSISAHFNRELVWQRFELALKDNNVALADYLRRFFDTTDKGTADFWLQIHSKPMMAQSLLSQNNVMWLINPGQAGRILVHGMERMAKDNLDFAIQFWDSKKREVAALDASSIQAVEQVLGLALAYNHDSRAYQRLDSSTLTDAKAREWKVRAALLEQNWQHISSALSGLTGDELKQPIWQYWLARSEANSGHTEVAKALYQKLAEDRSFYGFLAADKADKPYNLADKPVPLADNELENLAETDDFKLIRELMALKREPEALKQWWFNVEKLPKEQRRVVAKLAEQWQWDQLAILTLVKSDYWDDVHLRFPIRYADEVGRNSERQELNPALILALMRQESMLDKDAKSAVGARGLMQLMPATGREVGREMNEPLSSDDSLFEPEVNIRSGSYYFKKLLAQFNGHVALAVASYNAGPSRVKKWLPSDKPIPADIWVETIPYKETRKYVTSVLTYAIIYQQQLQTTDSNKLDLHTSALKMKNLLPEIPLL
jgi:soluble lytic murein transglycosylase